MAQSRDSTAHAREAGTAEADRAAATALNLAFGSAAGLGGSERRMLEVVSELRSRGLPIRSLVPGPRDLPLNVAMESAGAQLVLHEHPGQLVRQTTRYPAGATWAFGARAAYPLAIGRRLPAWRGGQLLIAKNGLEALRSPASMLLERMLIRSADLVVANSQAAGDLAVTRSRARPEQVRVLRSALSREWLTAPERNPRPVVQVAMIGNARPEKEHALGIRVFTQLDDPATVLHVYTNDGTEVRAQLSMAPAHLRQRVCVHEAVDVTPQVMRSVDVLLHPSSSESLPRVALEARAQGAWVVGFDVGDTARYCADEIAWGDEAGLTASLKHACQASRAGTWPDPVETVSVPEYVDRLLALVADRPAKHRRIGLR